VPLKREQLCSLWPKLKRPLELLEAWDSPRGIIFESDAASGLEAVTSAAAILGAHTEKFGRHPVLKDDWNERAGRFLARGALQTGLFESAGDRLCLVILDLDRQPEWLQLAVKAPMDRAQPPRVAVCVLTTAADASAIPDNVRSHFFVVRKNGRRRGRGTIA
jgi:hypothetical protein